MKREKRVKASIVTSGKKEVRSKVCNYSSEKICWRFSTMDMEGSFKFCCLCPEIWGKILSAMKEWDKKTWAEIMNNRDHFIPVDHLCSEAQRRLIDIKRDDIDGIYSLHIDGQSRFIGIRDRYAFEVLWWDPDHKVRPSHKKHT